MQSFPRKWAKIDLKTQNLVQKFDNFLFMSSGAYKIFYAFETIQRQIENKMKAMIKQMKKMFPKWKFNGSFCNISHSSTAI